MESNQLEKCAKYEKKILELGGLLPNEYSVANCPLGGGRHIHYVNVHKQPRKENNVLLMTHGYFCSSIGYFKMYECLKDDFHIVSFDASGWGLSSFEKETPDSAEQWIDYYVRDIKTMADQLGLKKFHIMGHSMGGFIMGHFLNRFPEMVQQVFLLSPGGVNRENPDYQKRIQDRLENSNWALKCFSESMIKKIFDEKESPMEHFLAKMFRGTIIKRFFGERLCLSKEEQKLFAKFCIPISKAKPSSEKCLGYLFKLGPMSDQPIMPILRKMHKKKRIVIMYGAWDWMDFQLTTDIVNREDLDISIENVTNAGHQLIFQNPKKVSQLVKYHIFMNEKDQESPK